MGPAPEHFWKLPAIDEVPWGWGPEFPNAGQALNQQVAHVAGPKAEACLALPPWSSVTCSALQSCAGWTSHPTSGWAEGTVVLPAGHRARVPSNVKLSASGDLRPRDQEAEQLLLGAGGGH